MGRKAITQSMKCDSCYEGNRAVEAKGRRRVVMVRREVTRIPLSYDLGQTWAGERRNTWGKNLDFSKPASRLEVGRLDNSECNGKGFQAGG